MTDWDAYYDAVAGRQPRDTVLAALAAGPPPPGGLAVDLGCGDGTDTLALAVDAAPGFAGRLLPRVPAADRDRLSLQVADFRTAELPECDLVHAGFSLFFCPPADFPPLWARVRAALRPGGRLAVHLLGPHDSWAGDPGFTVHDRAAVEALLAGLHVERLDEQDEDGWSYAGEKHWHLWHLLARRP